MPERYAEPGRALYAELSGRADLFLELEPGLQERSAVAEQQVLDTAAVRDARLARLEAAARALISHDKAEDARDGVPNCMELQHLATELEHGH